jgi:hypothetical protein
MPQIQAEATWAVSNIASGTDEHVLMLIEELCQQRFRDNPTLDNSLPFPQATSKIRSGLCFLPTSNRLASNVETNEHSIFLLLQLKTLSGASLPAAAISLSTTHCGNRRRHKTQ